MGQKLHRMCCILRLNQLEGSLDTGKSMPDVFIFVPTSVFLSFNIVFSPDASRHTATVGFFKVNRAEVKLVVTFQST